MTRFDPESRAAMKACGTGDHRGGAEGGRVSTVQYVGLVTLAGIWAVVSVLFRLESADLGARTAAWVFAASFAAASLVAAYGLVQLLRRIFA